MSFTGSFRQHFASQSNIANIGDVIDFDPLDTPNPPGYGFAAGPIYLSDMSYFITDNSILPTTGTQNEITMSVWIYPTRGVSTSYIFKITEAVNVDYAYLSIDSSERVNFKFGTVDVVNFGRSLIQLNQWNHILISIQRDHTQTLEFGSIGGAPFNLTNYRTYEQGTSQLSRTHLVINGTAYHRYTQPNGAYPDTSGFFQNDFATDDSSHSTFGLFSQSSTSSDLMTAASTDNTIFGGHYGSGTTPQTGVSYYKGAMYQFWLKNTYTDFTDANNIALFRNTNGTSVNSLPASPSVHFVGNPNFRNIGSLNVGSITLNKIYGSGISKP
jgi:hypothetical protein